MYYNRTLSDSFSRHIEKSGKLRWLFDFVKDKDELDFLVGKNNSREWISVHRGLSRIITLQLRKRNSQKIFIDGAGCYKDMCPHLYGEKNIDENFRVAIEDIINLLENDERFDRYYNSKKEGFYQNNLSRRYGICGKVDDPFVIVDKEAVIGYSDQAEKDRIFAPIQKRYKILQSILSNTDGNKFGKDLNKKSIGNELDFLALDKQGNLLIIEFKHGSSTSGIYLSPIQIGLYYDIFTSYPKVDLERAVFEMLAQKQKIGLINPDWTSPNRINSIIPVVIISGFKEKSTAKSTFHEVLKLLRGKLCNKFVNKLEVWKYTPGEDLSNW